jgi:hypothetical protein
MVAVVLLLVVVTAAKSETCDQKFNQQIRVMSEHFSVVFQPYLNTKHRSKT